VFRNAAIPVTTAAGLIVAYLVVGAAVVETIFSLDGIGSYLVDAVGRSDFPVVQAIAMIMVVVFLVVNLIVDVLYAWLDPRIALE
jgi:peptide/nickel transport system permease protein